MIKNLFKNLITAMLLVLLLHTDIYSQTNFWTSPAAFLGQKLPGAKPEVFAPGLLDSGGITLDRVAFSADGTEFYYCHALHWFESKGATIKYFKYGNKKWIGPATLNSGYYAPTFSADNKTLYFIGGGMQGVVWKSMRNGKSWTPPELYLKLNYGLYDFMPTISGRMYVGSNGHQGNIKDFSTYDFCELNISGSDTTIRKLQGPVNTPGFDGDFFIASDESYIIISTNESKDYESELYISFRNTDNTWSKPKSLGSHINNGKAHRWGQYVTPDNKYLFYTQGTSEKDCHIYWLRFDDLLKQLKKS